MMKMMRTFNFNCQRIVILMTVLPAVFLTAFPLPGAAIEFPGDGFVDGWQKKGQIREFTRNGLYGHIDGGSELFLEFGFQILHLQKYHNGADEISIETYRMDSAEAALGIYLMKCGNETPVPGITGRNSGDHYQIMVLKGNYYVKVNNFSGKSSLRPVMLGLVNKTLKKLPGKKPADLFSLLPRENRVKGSELLIRGFYSLQAIYTLGEGDILRLKNKIFGVTAQYQANKDTNRTYNRVIVRYPDDEYAQKAYSHILANLDSYITVLENRKNALLFKDFKGKLGTISLTGDLLLITFNLPDERGKSTGRSDGLQF